MNEQKDGEGGTEGGREGGRERGNERGQKTCQPGSRVQGLPPVTVELSVCKPQYFSDHVHHGVEEPVEEQQPEQVVRYLCTYESHDSHMRVTCIIERFPCTYTYIMT